jgi:prepilin-type N-terminal cleavage/methylation domain-containing protein
MPSIWSRDRVADRHPGDSGSAHGFSLLELVVVIGLTAVLSTTVVSLALSRLDLSRTAGAAWYVAGRMASARMEAAKRSAYVALQFVERDGGYRFAAYLDGNRNGVRTSDIAAGVDRRLGPEERLDQQFPGVGFGICEDVAAVEPGDILDGGDPIRIGRSSLLSFSPDGSATPGTVYIRGLQASQYAVRVLGATGRTRILRFDFHNHRWSGP